MEVLLSGLGGGILRLAPEVLRFMDGKMDRDHEFRLAVQHTEHLKVLGTERVDAMGNEYAAVAGLTGLQEAYIQKAADRVAKKYPIIDPMGSFSSP